MTNQHQLIKADTVYGLIQSVNDILRDRFASNGHTLSDNSWRTCDVDSLRVGFWKAIHDRDFGSILTYSAMLAGRGANVADLIMKMETGAITNLDTIRLQRITIEQHEKTIADLRTKLDGKAEPEPSHLFISGMAAESELVPELCYSVEAYCENITETLTIKGDPAAVKDLALAIRAEQTTRTGPSGGVNITLDSLKAKEDPVIAGTVAAAVADIYGKAR